MNSRSARRRRHQHVGGDLRSPSGRYTSPSEASGTWATLNTKSYKHEPLAPKSTTREVWHRYKHFRTLHVALTARGIHLPPLPRKHLFSSHSEAVIKEREMGLFEFMQAVARDPLASTLKETREFLGLAFADTKECHVGGSRRRTTL